MVRNGNVIISYGTGVQAGPVTKNQACPRSVKKSTGDPLMIDELVANAKCLE